jgi:putative transposase
MLISKKIRLDISEVDAATLEFMQARCRGLYNWWVMRLRDGEKWPGWKEAKKTLQASKEYDPDKRFLAWLGPHTGDPVRCADVFTAIV